MNIFGQNAQGLPPDDDIWKSDTCFLLLDLYFETGLIDSEGGGDDDELSSFPVVLVVPDDAADQWLSPEPEDATMELAAPFFWDELTPERATELFVVVDIIVEDEAWLDTVLFVPTVLFTAELSSEGLTFALPLILPLFRALSTFWANDFSRKMPVPRRHSESQVCMKSPPSGKNMTSPMMPIKPRTHPSVHTQLLLTSLRMCITALVAPACAPELELLPLARRLTTEDPKARKPTELPITASMHHMTLTNVKRLNSGLSRCRRNLSSAKMVITAVNPVKRK